MISGANDLNVIELVGLSKDTKPVNKYIKNGSLYLEMDTGKVFIFDEEYSRWLELGEETPLPPEPPTPGISYYKHEISWTGYYPYYDSEAGEDVWTSVEGEGQFSFISSSDQVPTTIEELYNLIDSSYSKIKWEYTDESHSENTYHYNAHPALLFNNKSSLLLGGFYYSKAGLSSVITHLVITSFTDTVTSENA